MWGWVMCCMGGGNYYKKITSSPQSPLWKQNLSLNFHIYKYYHWIPCVPPLKTL